MFEKMCRKFCMVYVCMLYGYLWLFVGLPVWDGGDLYIHADTGSMLDTCGAKELPCKELRYETTWITNGCISFSYLKGITCGTKMQIIQQALISLI